jgi:signal transduction histidine kinase
VSIQQVIANLVVNAIEAAEQGWSDPREVMVRTRLLRGQVECEVSDSGPGLASADVARVFDAFFTTKKEGIGLGLSIARAIVEAHHGQIWAEGLAGIGATFRVALPAIPDAHA